MFESLYQLGVDASLYFQSWGDGFLSFMRSITFLGSEDFYILGFPILTWLIDYGFGFRLGYMLIFSGIVNTYFKQFFAEPRPSWVDSDVPSLAGGQDTDFGFPSGHSQLTASMYGLAAAILKIRWVTVFVGVMIFLLGLSRIALGVHFVHDVLAGWILGFVCLWLYLKYENAVKSWLDAKPISQRNIIVFGLSLALIFINVLIINRHGNWEMPADWLSNSLISHPEEAPNPMTLDTIITLTAMMFGMTAGYYQTMAAGGFDAGGEWWRRLVRFLVGLVGVLAFWQGLDMVFPDSLDLVGYSFRYVRYALVGLWIAWWGPSLFVKMNLANRDQ